MAFLESFKEHFKQTRDVLTGKIGILDHKDKIDSNLEQMFRLVINEAHKSGSNDYSAIMKSLEQNKMFRGCTENIHSTIRHLNSENQNLKKKDKAITKADWGEKFRAFLLRMFTALGIASILLLTSYLALEWKIPLPLRMGLTP